MPNIQVKIIDSFPQDATPKSRSLARRFLFGFFKLLAYVTFVVVAVYYTPKFLSRALNTPYPLAAVTSGSMWPVLKINDLILMKGILGSQAQIGQIIIFRHDRGFTIHRLIRKENGKLVTKGDANNVEDAPILESDVVGRVIYIGQSAFRVPLLGIISKSFGPQLQNFTQNK